MEQVALAEHRPGRKGVLGCVPIFDEGPHRTLTYFHWTYFYCTLLLGAPQ